MGIDSVDPGEEDTVCLIFKFILPKPNQCYWEAETDFEGRNFLFGIDLNVLSGSCEFMVEIFNM